MSIRLLERVATLLRADAHGVVDALEERDLLVRQYLREAELELMQKRARCEALAEEARRLREEIARQKAEAAALDEDVALALGEGKDDLARFATRRLLARRKDVTQLEAQAVEVARTHEAVAERLAEQERELEALRSRARAHLAARRSGDAEGLFGEPAVADEEVELELLRRRGAPGATQ